MLIEMQEHLRYAILGETRDDAAGEAFDKVARLLELPYPGGPHLSKLAEQGNAKAFQFPRPMLHSKDLDFSFAGLKTAVLYKLKDLKAAPPREALERSGDVAASFQQAVVDSLVQKTVQAYQKIRPKVVLLAGGVAANALLRKQLQSAIEKEGGELRVAPLALCGDNAVMIGQVGLFALEAGRKIPWQEVDAKARVNIEKFTPFLSPP
jgi:N6-L-threonylcarbamoyladenine synthase